jgi:methylase of polypeptide subunit release factors
MLWGRGAARLTAEETALVQMLELLKARGYRFTAISPESHGRVLARSGREQAATIEDALGWSLNFATHVLPDDVRNCLRRADMVEREGGVWRSRVRVSSLRGDLFLHSPHPTDQEDAVFLGPDSYRFAEVVAAELTREPPVPPVRIVDIGTGTGVGGIVAARLCPEAEIVLTDINPVALRLARINAEAAGVAVTLVEANGLESVDGRFDVAMINPPFIAGGSGLLYRDGGGNHGAQLALELSAEAIDRLSPGGRLILYTGSPIIAGKDRLRATLERLAAAYDATMSYRELDPDVFSEELSRPAYDDVDRISLIAATMTVPR